MAPSTKNSQVFHVVHSIGQINLPMIVHDKGGQLYLVNFFVMPL